MIWFNGKLTHFYRLYGSQKGYNMDGCFSAISIRCQLSVGEWLLQMALQLDLGDKFYYCGISIIISRELGWLSKGQWFQGRNIVYFESATWRQNDERLLQRSPLTDVVVTNYFFLNCRWLNVQHSLSNYVINTTPLTERPESLPRPHGNPAVIADGVLLTISSTYKLVFDINWVK